MNYCLQDYIGVKACSIATVPESGIYINNLPGIELQNIEQLANDEQINFVGVWNEVQARALRRFRNDAIAMFAERYQLRQIQQTVNLQKNIDKTSVTPAAAQWRGFTIELNYENDTVVRSAMQDIYLQHINLYLPLAINTTVKLFDLDLGDEIYTTAVTGAIGWNNIKVNQSFDARRVFVCYDATLVNSVKQDISEFYLDNFNHCDGYYYTSWQIGTTSRLRGAKSTGLPSTVTSVTGGDNTYGLSAIWSVHCSYDSVICNNKEHFAQALLYCLGSELMTERIYSSRINRWTTVDKNKAIELRKFFEARYKGGVYDEVEYPGELRQAVEGIQLNKNDTCLQCNQKIIFADSVL
jgi:hypothetical protein